MSPFFPLWSKLSKLFHKVVSLCFCHKICVAAGVQTFVQNNLHLNNLNFCVVYLLHTWFVKALMSHKTLAEIRKKHPKNAISKYNNFTDPHKLSVIVDIVFHLAGHYQI